MAWAGTGHHAGDAVGSASVSPFVHALRGATTFDIDEPEHVVALRGLRRLFLDAGTRDEYALDIGARIFAAKLRELGVPHAHEEFEDGHMSITHRYDVSFPILWEALRD